jgi:ankyrin repeat protein
MAHQYQITCIFSALLICSTGPLVAYADEIHRLIRDGEIDKAKALVVKNAKLINAPDRELDETPLHLAAHRGHVGLVQFLLERGADVNAQAYNKFTPLRFAENPDIVKLLIEHKTDLEVRDAFDCTILQDAADMCARCEKQADVPQRKKVKLLLAAGATYDIQSAICLGDLDRVRALLRDDPREAQRKGLMRIAAEYNRVAIAKLLIEHKAVFKETDRNGLPVIYFALEHPEMVRLLLQAGVDPKTPLSSTFGVGLPREEDTTTLLHVAACRGQVETAKLLLEAGVPVDIRTANGETPLRWAAEGGYPEMVKLLLKHKATVEGEDGSRTMSAAAREIRPAENTKQREENARYREVISILRVHHVPYDFFTAIALGNARHVRFLLEEKPALARSKEGNSPEGELAVHRAVKLDHTEIVALLLDAGASVNGKDQYGYTALHEAAFWGREEVAKLLIERNADVNARADNGFTPLHESARLNTPAVARLLLAAGAQVNAKDKEGRTPLSWAEKPEIVKLLRERGGEK